MSEIKIRQYQPSDLNDCQKLWAELTEKHREIYDDPTIGGENPGLYFDKLLAQVSLERLWVAECEGRVVGLTGLILNEQEAEVEPLIVTPAFRCKGIGRALLKYAIEQAKKLEVRYLSVRPVARNEDAISFFYKSGFRLLGHIEMFMDLKPAKSNAWKSGIKLFKHNFGY